MRINRSARTIQITGWPALVLILGILGAIIVFVRRFRYFRRSARDLEQRSNSQHRALFEQNPCPMLVYDTRSQAILTANPAMAELLGYSVKALTCFTLRDLFPADVTDEAEREYGSGEPRPPQPGPLRTRMHRSDGSAIEVDARGRPIDMFGGHARVVIVLDITEQHAAELALREAEQRARATSEVLQSLIDVAPQAIIAMNHEFQITLWNRAAETLFEWTADEVIGARAPFVPPEEQDSFLARSREVSARGIVGPSEVTRMRKNGTRIELLASSGALPSGDKRAAGSITVFTDLTAHRQLEAQLRQSQKMEAVGRLSGGIAHDFNNMLTVITSYVQLLQARHGVDDDSEDLAEISAAAMRAAGLTRQLLTFSRQQIVQVSSVNLGEVVERIRPMLRRVSAENIDLRSTLASDLGAVLVDAAQMEQVMMNLAMNALDAMPDGGSLVFETANVELDADYASLHPEVKPGPYVMLAASDSGCGMSAATLGKIFEPFFTTKEPGRGTGLGLATTYSIVRQAGGHIWVYSEPGRGTTFKIFLPRIDAEPVNPSRASRATTAVGRDGTILLVEDDDAVRRSVCATLARLGYEVLDAASGEAGLAVARNYDGKIDAVLTDLMMPGLSGREFAERLTVSRPDVRVLFTSGYTDDEVIRRRLVDEGQTFLQKPFTSEQLVSALEALPEAWGSATRDARYDRALPR
ncbi:MAG: PAS domain S-box protein [bacterium]